MTLLNAKQSRMHPRAQVQTLRRIAMSASRKGNTARAQAAIDEMVALDIEHKLGYGGTK